MRQASAVKVLLLEAIGMAVFAGLLLWAAKPWQVKQPPLLDPPPGVTTTRPIAMLDPKLQAKYDSQARSVIELLKETKLEKDVDVVVLMLDASESMDTSRGQIEANLQEILRQYQGKPFMLIEFQDRPQVSCAATQDPAKLNQAFRDKSVQAALRNEAGAIFKTQGDAVQGENSLAALEYAANEAQRGGFRKPVMFLITDAAPNDPARLEPSFQAVKKSRAALYVLAGYNEAESAENGSAIESRQYEELVRKLQQDKLRAEIKFLR
jgi:uncharacterized protein YegL